MPRLPLFIASVLLITIAAAHAQGSKQNPPPSKPLLDNERMRVSEMRWNPGAKVELPNRPDQFAYLLTDATLVFSVPGRTPYQIDLKAGEATLLPAQSTEAENDGDKEVRALLVEIKSGTSARASASRGKTKTSASAKGKGGKKRS